MDRWEVGQTWSFRGSTSRNKVTVGEPAVGSLLMGFIPIHCVNCFYVPGGGAGFIASPTDFFERLLIKSWNSCYKVIRNNFWQRISWLSQRWRTQWNAIRNVNCRIQWIIESLNAYCALWYSGEHACLSTFSFSRPTLVTQSWSLGGWVMSAIIYLRVD